MQTKITRLLSLFVKFTNSFQLSKVTGVLLYYRKAKVACSRLTKRYQGKYDLLMAAVYTDNGLNEKDQKEFFKAKKYYNKALKIYKKQVLLNEEDTETYFAAFMNNYAILYVEMGDTLNYLDYNFKALEIMRRLAQKDPYKYNPSLALTLYNIGIVLSEKKDFAEAKTMLQEALKIREELAYYNPSVYLVFVARTGGSLANLYAQMSDFNLSFEQYDKSIEILNDLCKPECLDKIEYEIIKTYLNKVYAIRLSLIKNEDSKLRNDGIFIINEMKNRLIGSKIDGLRREKLNAMIAEQEGFYNQ
jgi:tetratricopeptide (TPR) repeat protein